MNLLTNSSGEVDFAGINNQIGMYILRIKTSEKEYSKVVFL